MFKVGDLVMLENGVVGIVKHHIIESLFVVDTPNGETICCSSEMKLFKPTNEKYPSQTPIIKCKVTTTYHLFDEFITYDLIDFDKISNILELKDLLNGVLEYVCENNGCVTYVDDGYITTILYEFWED